MRKVLQRAAASAGQLVGVAPERDVFIRYPKPAQGIPNCLGEGEGFAPFLLLQVGPETKTNTW